MHLCYSVLVLSILFKVQKHDKNALSYFPIRYYITQTLLVEFISWKRKALYFTSYISQINRNKEENLGVYVYLFKKMLSVSCIFNGVI